MDGDAEHLAKAREQVARSVAAATDDLVDVDVKVDVLSFLYFVKTSAIGDFDATRVRGRGFNVSGVGVRGVTTEDKEEESVVLRSANVLRISAVFDVEVVDICDLRIRIQKQQTFNLDDTMDGHDCVAFIANMSYEYNAARIIDLFSRVGQVLFLEMRPDPSGRHEHVGQGHIVFGDSATMVKACETLSGETVGGRPIRVTKSKDPTSTAGVLQRMKMAVPGGIPASWGAPQQSSILNPPTAPQAAQILHPGMLTPSIPRSTSPAGPRAPLQVHTHVPAFPAGVDVDATLERGTEGRARGARGFAEVLSAGLVFGYGGR
jgi:hypothetical protein